MSKISGPLEDFETLKNVIKALRAPDGCPWDLKQTFKSLAKYTIEEAHELAEALESDDSSAIKDELGDVLLQVVLNSEIARQEQLFDIHDVIKNLNEKMIRRHPHVFADKTVSGPDEVTKNWDEIKAQEPQSKKIMLHTPPSLSALATSQDIGKQTKKVGFDWSEPSAVLDKVEEELNEVRQALKTGVQENIEEEFGDLFFSLAQVCRHLKIDAESANRQANRKFRKRFDWMIKNTEGGLDKFATLEPADKEALWNKAKLALKAFE